ncbi:hypothetical protein BRADI_1g68701v3 [Brachypodium distachyon]|uniref:Uncharacterized protein n=1 Tax=Brachypodium distachyon TaxID=15368 RepID=A0A2K2DU32_BRADI|nr:hypothetical protein BRADI_1g68701v3 [Brachypodium distachyon]PNT77779.1 hypothetical protein BRADI_1g68701v3 [Brachypodium distachyon]
MIEIAESQHQKSRLTCYHHNQVKTKLPSATRTGGMILFANSRRDQESQHQLSKLNSHVLMWQQYLRQFSQD